MVWHSTWLGCCSVLLQTLCSVREGYWKMHHAATTETRGARQKGAGCGSREVNREKCLALSHGGRTAVDGTKQKVEKAKTWSYQHHCQRITRSHRGLKVGNCPTAAASQSPWRQQWPEPLSAALCFSVFVLWRTACSLRTMKRIPGQDGKIMMC